MNNSDIKIRKPKLSDLLRRRKRPLLMAILNLTPDSFSDGGQFADENEALLTAMEMVDAGADIIDVGGESTKPGAKEVSADEEIFRILPFIESFRGMSDVALSIDTRHSLTAKACLDAGADIINDVSALADPDMAEIIASHDAGVVLMHGYKQHISGDHSGNRPNEIIEFLRKRIDFAVNAGIQKENIIIDPGIGFGKDAKENIAVLQAIPDFLSLGLPLLIASSRKRFIGEITGVTDPKERVSGSLAAMLWAISKGADIVRMHDVRAAREAIDIATAFATVSARAAPL